MKPRKQRVAFEWLALLAATIGWGHSWSQTPATPTFPSGIELITVDAVAVDDKGRPVAGLTKDDFVLQEDGQPQEIANFEAILLPGPTEGPGAAAPLAPQSPRPRRIATSAPPTARGSTFLVVVDDIHLTGTSAAEARTTLERFLRTSVSPGDRVTVASTGTGAAWSGTLPADRDDLLAFVGRLQGRNTNPVTPLMTEYEALRIALYNDDLSLRRAIGRYLNQGACAAPPYPCEQKVRSDAQANQAHDQATREASLAAIERVIAEMARLHGRKSVLLLSAGFIHDDAPEEGYHRVVGAAQRANAAIYFINVRGLEALPASASAEAARDMGIDALPGIGGKPADVQKALETMALVAHERFTPEVKIGVETMAEETGGFVVRNTNDLAGQLNRISTESRSYYLLGYHPAIAKDAGFRKIEVKVKRAGVHVRARKGYDSPSGAKEARAPSSDEVPLRLATYTLEPAAEQKTRVMAVTEIDVSGLAFAEREGRRVAQLDVRLEAIPRDGGKVQGRRLSIETEAPAAEAPPTGFWRPLRIDLALPPGVYQVRASVTEVASGKAGAASQRVVVPDPSAFHVSTPILSNAATPATEAGSPPVPAPVAHERFSSADGPQLVCAFEVFGAAKDAVTGRYDVLSRLVLRSREGQTLAAPDPRPIAVSTSGQSQQVLVLPLAKLPAGDYELALTVEDRVAGKKEELVETFTAEDAPVAARATPPPSAPTALAPVPPVPPELIPVLERAGQYVVGYSRTFSNILADEEYRQQGHQENEGGPLIVRKMRSGVVFITLPGPIPWATFRDVFEVDGNKVRDRQERLARLFQDSPASAREKAKAILEEGARFNLGPIRRTVNIPALALLFLHPENQRRFTFAKKGRRAIDGIEALEIAFVERARPTLIGDDAGHDVPAKGSVWIDPARGTVLQTDVDYDLDPRDTYHRTRARIVTTYRREPKLDILVPDSMKEAYQWPVARQQAARVQRRGLNRVINEGEDQDDVVGLEAEARYSGYRRFDITTEESFAPKPNER